MWFCHPHCSHHFSGCVSCWYNQEQLCVCVYVAVFFSRLHFCDSFYPLEEADLLFDWPDNLHSFHIFFTTLQTVSCFFFQFISCVSYFPSWNIFILVYLCFPLDFLHFTINLFLFSKTLPFFLYLFYVVCLGLIFGSSFSKNLSGGAHLYMCKKHFRVSSGLLTDLCQIHWCLYITKLSCQHLCCQMFSLVTPGSSVT